MSFVVRKSSLVVVRPSEPVTTTGNINLSPYDRHFVSMPVTMFLVFEHPIHEPAETIKRGLSQALVHYHPISGRLAAGADGGEVHIRCTGEGVSFVAASANCAVKEVKFFDRRSPAATSTLLNELAIYYPTEGCGHTDPLLMMQVTEFSCGGFVVGVTWNHAIADGTGMGQFLQAVGELTRGLSSPSVVPVRWDDSLKCIPPSILQRIGVVGSLQPLDMPLLDITVPLRLINCIKDEFRGHCNGQPCTVFEAVIAVLWQCRTRAIISDPDALALLCFWANARSYVGTKDGYYGNCATGQLVVATSGEVANADVMDLVKKIRRAKDQIPDQFKKGDGSLLQEIGLQPLGVLFGYSLLQVTSWRNLGLDEADFGGGTPARVMANSQRTIRLPTCVACLPCEGWAGSNVFTGCVKEEHADAFLGELARFNLYRSSSACKDAL